jgi:hypothetical protein
MSALLAHLTIAQLYRCSWQIEPFFKWIKQLLRIKAFYGTSENVVRIQVWIAVAVPVLVAMNSIPFCFARHNCFRWRCAHPLGHARGRGAHRSPMAALQDASIL